MFSFLKNSTPKDAAVPGSALVSTQQDSAPQSVQPHTDIKRELIRVVLKDTLRQQSIPYEWIGCEISNIATGTADEQFHIQLVVMKWSELLMRYAMALQKQLLRGLDRFDPAVDHSNYVFSWRFAPDCGCPFTVMPPPLLWSHGLAPAPAEEEPSILDRRHEIRPAPPPGDGDYERTQLSPFR